MPDKELNVTIGADTDPLTKAVKKAAGELDKLESSDVEVPIDADLTDAERELRRFHETTSRLEDKGIIVPVKVDEASIGRAKASAEKVGDGGSDVGKRFGTSFIRDVGSTFNAQGAGLVGDLSEGIFAAAEGVGGKFADTLAGPVGAAFGIGGLAFVAVQQFWGMWNKGAEDAKKRVEEAKKVTLALATGDFADAAANVLKAVGEGNREFAASIGITDAAIASFVTGAEGAPDVVRRLNEQLADLTPEYQKAKVAAETGGAAAQNHANEIGNQVTQLAQLRDALARASGEQKTANTQTENAQRAQAEAMIAIGATSDALLEQATKSVPAVRKELLYYVAQLNGIPPEKVTEVIADTNPEDVQQLQTLIANTEGTTVKVKADTSLAEAALRRLQGQLAQLGIDYASLPVNPGVVRGDAEQPGITGPATAGAAPQGGVATLTGPGMVGSAWATPTGGTDVTITVNAGFGTDAFAVKRAVVAATAEAARQIGRRP